PICQFSATAERIPIHGCNHRFSAVFNKLEKLLPLPRDLRCCQTVKLPQLRDISPRYKRFFSGTRYDNSCDITIVTNHVKTIRKFIQDFSIECVKLFRAINDKGSNSAIVGLQHNRIIRLTHNYYSFTRFDEGLTPGSERDSCSFCISRNSSSSLYSSILE